MNVYALVDTSVEHGHVLLGVYPTEAQAQAEIDACVGDGFPNTSLWWEIQPVEVTE